MKIALLTPIHPQFRTEQTQRSRRLAIQFQQLGCPADDVLIHEPAWQATDTPDTGALSQLTASKGARTLWRRLVLRNVREAEAVVFNFTQLGPLIPAQTLAVAYNAAHSWEGVHLLLDPAGSANAITRVLEQVFAKVADSERPPPLLRQPAEFIKLRQPAEAFAANRKARR